MIQVKKNHLHYLRTLCKVPLHLSLPTNKYYSDFYVDLVKKSKIVTESIFTRDYSRNKRKITSERVMFQSAFLLQRKENQLYRRSNKCI